MIVDNEKNKSNEKDINITSKKMRGLQSRFHLVFCKPMILHSLVSRTANVFNKIYSRQKVGVSQDSQRTSLLLLIHLLYGLR